MSETYPTLPHLAARQPDETAVAYGLRVLAFVVACQVTGTLTEDDLRAADHAYPVSLGRETSVLAVDRFTAARHQILRALRQRHQERDQERAQPSVFPKSDPATPPHLVKVQPVIPRLPSGGVALPFQQPVVSDAF